MPRATEVQALQLKVVTVAFRDQSPAPRTGGIMTTATTAVTQRAPHCGLRRQRSGVPAVVLPRSPNPDRPRDGHRWRAPLRASPRNAAGGGATRPHRAPVA